MLLILLMGIIVVLGTAFYLSSKQNRELKKRLIKKEPQFSSDTTLLDVAEEKFSSVHQTVTVEKNSEEIFWQENENLLMGDALTTKSSLQDKQTQSQFASSPISDDLSKHEAQSRSTNRPAAILNAEIICLMVLAPLDRPHTGYELLQSLLSAGLRYGPMNIFHRFEDTNGRGKILFSVASIEEPGTFEINKMGAYSGKGLMMFLRFSSGKDLSSAFEIMLDTAKQLIEDLGGQILDDEKQVLNPEKIEKWRKKVAAFEQKQLTPDLFDM